jgi:hypothetical protein
VDERSWVEIQAGVHRANELPRAAIEQHGMTSMEAIGGGAIGDTAHVVCHLGSLRHTVAAEVLLDRGR